MSKVEIIDHEWIPLSDGTRLSARIWLPEGARENPAPAILEYLPYRKDDLCAERDQGTHGGFARHGYVGVRVDIRGTGDSEGVLRGEYLLQEQDDAVEAIAWIADQEWCSGRVGMMGISWGGFNSLQVAARRPRGLAAVISVCSTDDRYSDDVHYIGGCVNAWDAVLWSNSLTLFSALPPTRPLSETSGARCGSPVSTRQSLTSWSGSNTSGAMSTGSTGRCARTFRPCRCLST
ncbi:MAG: CocE/NonD family hydrolase [Thermoleophilia bacterium]|nr:CocE/NonD family hydrolase [Thermoleophilia bacterium]